MTDSDGAHIFPPRADDQRIIDAVAAQGGPFGLGVDGDFRQALGLFLGLSDQEILAHSVDDMWRHYLDDQGLVNAAEPFSFDLGAAAGDPDIGSYSLTTASGGPVTIIANNHLSPHFSLSGDRIYWARASSYQTFQYGLSIPGDLSTLTGGFEATQDWRVNSQFMRSFAMTPDRTKAYKMRRSSGSGDLVVSGDPFSSVALGDPTMNPWPITNTIFSPAIITPVTPGEFVVAPNNLDMFIMSKDITDRAIYHEQMSVAGDASTLTPQGQALDLSIKFATFLYGITYTPDGSKLFVLGDDSGTIKVVQYDLTVAYDVNTAVDNSKEITVTPAFFAQVSSNLTLTVWANPSGGFKLYLTYHDADNFNNSLIRWDLYDAP